MIVAGVGDHVHTMFGVGVVVQYRAPCPSLAAPLVDAIASSSAPTASKTLAASSSPAPFAESESESIARMSAPAVVKEAPSAHKTCSTNVGIYVVKLMWHDGGGAIAYLNGRSIRKITETSQRRCVVM